MNPKQPALWVITHFFKLMTHQPVCSSFSSFEFSHLGFKWSKCATPRLVWRLKNCVISCNEGSLGFIASGGGANITLPRWKEQNKYCPVLLSMKLNWIQFPVHLNSVFPFSWNLLTVSIVHKYFIIVKNKRGARAVCVMCERNTPQHLGSHW